MTEALSDLRIERRIARPIDAVWKAWTDPALLAQWISPNPELEVTAGSDLIVGGSWWVLMGPYGVRGQYVEIEPMTRLGFTWKFDHEPDAAPTLVTVELSDLGNETTLVLTHSGFADPENRSGNAEGWGLCLARLDNLPAR